MAIGNLLIISTPIGNYADLTLRALRLIEEHDFIICEEYKEATRLLKFFNIKKDLKPLNEHNEDEATEEYFHELLGGKKIALISDCGTPAFADPGLRLIQKCIEYNIKLEFIPGANSILAAVVLSGFDISRFYYIGFLSPKKETRRKELNELTKLNKTFIIIDTPYRLKTVLKDLNVFFPGRKIYIGFNLTMNNEMQLSDFASDIIEHIEDISEGKKLKGEYVIVVDKVKKSLE